MTNITSTSVEVDLKVLASDPKPYCEMRLYYSYYKGLPMKNICGKDGNQECQNKCEKIVLSKLLPLTEYILEVKQDEFTFSFTKFKTSNYIKNNKKY